MSVALILVTIIRLILAIIYTTSVLSTVFQEVLTSLAVEDTTVSPASKQQRSVFTKLSKTEIRSK